MARQALMASIRTGSRACPSRISTRQKKKRTYCMSPQRDRNRESMSSVTFATSAAWAKRHTTPSVHRSSRRAPHKAQHTAGIGHDQPGRDGYLGLEPYDTTVILTALEPLRRRLLSIGGIVEAAWHLSRRGLVLGTGERPARLATACRLAQRNLSSKRTSSTMR